MWRLYGWFSALMACGSFCGTVAWWARLMLHVNLFKSNASLNLAEQASLFSLAVSWTPAYIVSHAIEFMCICAAKLMVLDRMSVFVAPEDAVMQKRWATAWRGVMVVAVLGNTVGFAGTIASAVHYQKAAEAGSAASAHYNANSTSDGNIFFALSRQERQRGASIFMVQRFSEAAVLLLTVNAFFVVGAVCMRRFSASMAIFDAASQRASISMNARLKISDAAATGSALRLQMLGTTSFIFVACLLRAVFSTMYAVAFGLQNFDKTCPGVTSICDTSCYNVYSHIAHWLSYTPEFHPIITLLSSPVAQLVALWGVTTKSTLQLMMSSSREKNVASTLTQRKKEEEELSML